MGKRTVVWTVAALLVLLAVGLYAWKNHTPAQLSDRPTSNSTESETVKERDMLRNRAPSIEEMNATKQAGTVPIIIQTARGDIELQLRGDLMPLTVANFVGLARSGFYDGLTFHRVEDWVIQGGDPRGNGTGGPGYTIKLETSPQLKNVRGAVAMARTSDPDSAGSQFYILRVDAPWLDGQYAVFGKVTVGMDVVDKMQSNDKIIKVTVGG